MKEVLKRTSRSLWRATAWVRRPFRRKLDALLDAQRHALAEDTEQRIGAALSQVEARLTRRSDAQTASQEETNLLLDAVLAEIERMRAELASLRELHVRDEDTKRNTIRHDAA